MKHTYGTGTKYLPPVFGLLQVAAVLVAALSQSGASNKTVEIVAAKGAPELPRDRWFTL
jgi:hypothetical protein